jgi:SH3-like domain-containing protein
VTYDGDTGWVAAKVLAPSGGGVKIAPLATRYSVHVYATPSLNARVVGVIPAETQVDVTGCQNHSGRSWCHVNYGDASGYIRGSLLKRVDAVLNPRSF